MNSLKSFIILIILFIQNCTTHPKQSEKIPNEFKHVFARDGLRLRESPDLKSKSLEIIPYKSEIEIIKKTRINLKLENDLTGEWIETKWKNKTGFVFDGYLLDKKEFISFDKAYNFVKNKFLTKIKYIGYENKFLADDWYWANTKIERNKSESKFIGKNFASKYKIPDDWDFLHLRFAQKKSNSNFTIYTFMPTKHLEGCIFYTDANCINVILNDKDEIVFTDLNYESFGLVYYIDKELVRFGISGGEGDGCGSYDQGSDFIYIFDLKKFYKKGWSEGKSCLSKNCSPGINLCDEWGSMIKDESFFDSKNNPIKPTEKIKEYFLREKNDTK